VNSKASDVCQTSQSSITELLTECEATMKANIGARGP